MLRELEKFWFNKWYILFFDELHLITALSNQEIFQKLNGLNHDGFCQAIKGTVHSLIKNKLHVESTSNFVQIFTSVCHLAAPSGHDSGYEYFLGVWLHVFLVEEYEPLVGSLVNFANFGFWLGFLSFFWCLITAISKQMLWMSFWNWFKLVLLFCEVLGLGLGTN